MKNNSWREKLWKCMIQPKLDFCSQLWKPTVPSTILALVKESKIYFEENDQFMLSQVQKKDSFK